MCTGGMRSGLSVVPDGFRPVPVPVPAEGEAGAARAAAPARCGTGTKQGRSSGQGQRCRRNPLHPPFPCGDGVGSAGRRWLSPSVPAAAERGLGGPVSPSWGPTAARRRGEFHRSLLLAAGSAPRLRLPLLSSFCSGRRWIESSVLNASRFFCWISHLEKHLCFEPLWQTELWILRLQILGRR